MFIPPVAQARNFRFMLNSSLIDDVVHDGAVIPQKVPPAHDPVDNDDYPHRHPSNLDSRDCAVARSFVPLMVQHHPLVHLPSTKEEEREAETLVQQFPCLLHC